MLLARQAVVHCFLPPIAPPDVARVDRLRPCGARMGPTSWAASSMCRHSDPPATNDQGEDEFTDRRTRTRCGCTFSRLECPLIRPIVASACNPPVLPNPAWWNIGELTSGSRSLFVYRRLRRIVVPLRIMCPALARISY